MSKTDGTKTLLGSASQLHRTIPCPASWWLPATAERDPKWDEAANRGTAGHLYAQFAVDGKRDKKEVLERIDVKYHDFLSKIDLKVLAGSRTGLYNREVALVHDAATGKCRDVPMPDFGHRDYGEMLETETPGTADVVIPGFRTLEIWDYKFGKWPVSPVRNRQLLQLALAAKGVCAPNATTFVLGIQQIDENGIVKTSDWVIDRADLDEYEDTVREAQGRARRVALAVVQGTDNVPVRPDDENGHGYCKFCPARPACPAYKEGEENG